MVVRHRRRSAARLAVRAATIGSEAIGAMFIPGLLALAIVLVPWLDRSAPSPHFAESPTASPTRLA